MVAGYLCSHTYLQIQGEQKSKTRGLYRHAYDPFSTIPYAQS
jgi:hypothetical protein